MKSINIKENEQNNVVIDSNIYVSYVVGYRIWSLRLNELILRSLLFTSHHDNEKWPYRESLEFKCYTNYLGELSPHCFCGIYSFNGEVKGLYIPSLGLGYIMICGTVNQWGKVIVCEYGYRSEFAYPNEITHFVCNKCWKPIRNVKDGTVAKDKIVELPIVCINCVSKESVYTTLQQNFKDICSKLSNLYAIPVLDIKNF